MNGTSTGKKWADNYKDPRWHKKRLEIMERDGFKCRACGSADITLNVHHAYYDKGKMPWEYPDRSLTTLCEDCHNRRHNFQKLMLIEIGMLSKEEFLGLFHLLYISGATNLLQAIHDHPAPYNGFVDYGGLAAILPVLTHAFEAGLGEVTNEQ